MVCKCCSGSGAGASDGGTRDREESTASWASWLDAHGVAQLHSAGAWGRPFWAGMLLLALSALLLGVCATARDYWYNPIVSTIAVVPVQRLQLPSVYLCPANFINHSRAFRLGTDLRPADYFNWAAASDGGTLLSEKATVWEKLAPAGDESSVPPVMPDDFQAYILSIGYDTAAFVRECRFHTSALDCGRLFSAVLDRSHGKCFVADTGGMEQSTPALGLSLVLDVHTAEASPSRPALFDGVYLRVERPFDPARHDRLLLQPGRYTKVSLAPRRTTLIEVRGRGVTQRCNGSRADFAVFADNLTYSVEACQADCVLSAVLAQCGCMLPYDRAFLSPRAARAPLCSVAAMDACVHNASTSQHSSSAPCARRCYAPCDSWHYAAEVSSMKFPSNELVARSRRLGDTIGRWQRDLILLDVAFDQLQYVHVQQAESMTAATLVSNLGGQMGIWLGASLLTLVQFALIAFGGCCVLLKRKLLRTDRAAIDAEQRDTASHRESPS